MKKLLSLFSLFIWSLVANQSSVEELAVLQGDSSALVGGCINAITGDYLLQQNDAVVNGAEPYAITRQYTSRQYKNRHQLSSLIRHAWAIMQFDHSIRAYVPEPTGISLEYQPSREEVGIDKKGYVFKQPLHLFPNSNQVRAGLVNNHDSHYHPITNKAVFDNDTLSIYHADGSYRVYKFHDRQAEKFDELAVSVRTTVTFLLHHEKLPNGNFIRYKWKGKEKAAYLRSVKTKSACGKTLARIDIEKKDQDIEVKTSDNHLLKYHFTKGTRGFVLKKTHTAEYPKETLKYDDEGRLESRNFPNDRFLKIEYHENGRVKKLKGPQGTLYRFYYHRGYTQVCDAQKNHTFYHYDPFTLRLSKIETYEGDHTLLKTETFQWDDWGNLLKKQVCDPSIRVEFSYAYDQLGKLLSKTVSGCISAPDSQDQVTTRYTYDEQNRLIEESEDTGKAVTFNYLADTHLPVCKTVYKDHCQITQTRYKYDENHFLIEEITETGGHRFIKRITPNNEEELFGLPRIIEERYVENGQEKLLKRIQLHYDEWKNVSSKTVYGSDGQNYGTTRTIFNSRGQLTHQYDPLNHETRFEYDGNGNKTKEYQPQGLVIDYVYDTSNRLVEKQENGLITKYSYKTGATEPISILDPLKGITHFKYDARGNLVETQNMYGHLVHTGYNALNHKQTQTDPLGHTTCQVTNIFGHPLTITYPNGTQEHYTYNRDGTKATYIDQNGLKIVYSYDTFGNICKEALYSSDGAYLGHTTKTYSALHLLEETDLEGNRTAYTYNAAGQLIEKKYVTATTSYAYDAIGRRVSESILDYTIKKTYDLLGRVIVEEEHSNDTLLTKTLYGYSYGSEPVKICRFPHNCEATTYIDYDPFFREIARTDPLGNTTKTEYIVKIHILEKIITEPGDIQIIETYNPLNQLISIEKKHKNEVIARTDFSYDPCGNKTLESTHIFGREAPPHTISVTYDSLNRKISETEADKRTTYYSYTPDGKLSILKKPDEVILTYTYDPLGYQASLKSSDNSIHYTYNHNKLGHLLRSHDHIRNLTTTRILDPYGNVLEEALANGYTLKNTYDQLQRRTSLTLPNNKTVTYTYQGPYLKKVTVDKRAHTYNYDLAGNVIEETHIDGTTTTYKYDALSRPLALSSPHTSHTQRYCSRGNIIERDNKPYIYDAYDHLIQEPEHTYSYDSLHNQLSKDALAYPINDLNQIATSSYDPNGNLTPPGYVYDALDRLIQTGSTTYTYDAQHRRICKDDVAFIWDEQHELGILNHYRILGATPNAEIGAAVAICEDDTLQLPLHDLQGNLTQLRALDGSLLVEQEFTAFGEGKALLPWGFASKRTDPETDLVYFGRRYYDPTTARFITADPEGYTDSPNLYAYVLNNPLSHHDPYGLMLSFASPFFGDWTKHQNYSLGNTGSKNEINYANQFVQSAINGSMHNIIDNAQFFGSFVTATGDMISAPYTMGIKKDFSLEGLFQNTNTLLRTTSLGREWVGQQFPKANNVIGHMGYHTGYLATEAAIMVGTLGASATKNATRILEFSYSNLKQSIQTLLKRKSQYSGINNGKSAGNSLIHFSNITGRRGWELINPHYQNTTRHVTTTIQNRLYSGHALDQMQNRGFVPSVVENTVRKGQIFSTKFGTIGYYDNANNVRVIVNSNNGKVITIIPGAPK